MPWKNGSHLTRFEVRPGEFHVLERFLPNPRVQGNGLVRDDIWSILLSTVYLLA